jgi:hypothetical protein
MAITDKPWDGSASRWPDIASYCESCLLDLNPPGTPSDKKTQANCKLPIKEPNGDINTNALSPALGALNGARGGLKDVSPQDRKAAARKLAGAYRAAKLDLPDSLKRMI